VDARVESVDMKDVSEGLQERLDADLPLIGGVVGIPCIHALTSSSTRARFPRDERRASSSTIFDDDTLHARPVVCDHMQCIREQEVC